MSTLGARTSAAALGGLSVVVLVIVLVGVLAALAIALAVLGVLVAVLSVLVAGLGVLVAVLVVLVVILAVLVAVLVVLVVLIILVTILVILIVGARRATASGARPRVRVALFRSSFIQFPLSFHLRRLCLSPFPEIVLQGIFFGDEILPGVLPPADLFG